MVPAWKRLGLKLKNADQSGDSVPDQKEPRSLEQPVSPTASGKRGSGEGSHEGVEAAQNGKSSRLGKRKLQDSPAEEDDKASKKSRKSQRQDKTYGDAAGQSPSPSQTGSLLSSVPEAVLSSDTSRPKGDPNYRKKKGPQSKASQPSTAVALKDQGGGGPADDFHPGSKTWQPQSLSLEGGSATEQEPALLASTETDFATPSPATGKPSQALFGKFRGSALSSSPSKADRRKSVTFTPDTKTTDGDSASALFKKWVAEQKEYGEEASFTPAEVAQFVPPPKVHPANGVPLPRNLSSREDPRASDTGNKNKKKQEQTGNQSNIDPSLETQPTVPKAKGKKKDPSVYLAYLADYHSNRSNWKFNKAKQNDVLDNALNIFRIPEQYIQALTEYVQGLQGAAAIKRLSEKCQAAIEEVDKEDEKAKNSMNDIEAREAAKETALQERIAKQKKRRQTDADIEALADHPYPEGYIRRLKRRRAEALLLALNLTAPLPAPAIKDNGTTNEKKPPLNGPSIKLVRKRKSRTEMSSDESSTDSSSSEDTSSGEDSDEDAKESSSESDEDSSASGSESSSNDDSGTSEDDDKDDISSEISSSNRSGSSDESEDGESDR